jgi:ketosteroid isomerase-like protein
MRSLTLVGVLILMGSSATAADDSDTPKALIETWAAAYQSGNPDRILPSYEDAETVFAIASSGKRYNGSAAVKQMYEGDFAAYEFENVTTKNLEIVESGDVAWATFRFVAEVTSKEDKSKKLWTSQATMLLRKSNNTWKVAWEHFSPIEGVQRITSR